MMRLSYKMMAVVALMVGGMVLYAEQRTNPKLSKADQLVLKTKAEEAVEYASSVAKQIAARSLALERLDINEIDKRIDTLKSALINATGVWATASKRTLYEQAILILEGLKLQQRTAVRAGMEQTSGKFKIKTAVEAKKEASKLLDVFKIKLTSLNGLITWWYQRLLELTEERDRILTEAHGTQGNVGK